jgi:hypothetical protein
MSIEWHFAEKKSAEIFEMALKERKLDGIKVKHTPLEFKKNE